MDSLVINGVQRCSNNLDEQLIFIDLRNWVIGIQFKNIGSVAKFMVDPSLHVGGNREGSHGYTRKNRSQIESVCGPVRWEMLKPREEDLAEAFGVD